MKIFKVIGTVGLLLALTIPVWSAEYTVRDRNYRTEGHVNNGKIYDRDYRIKGYVTKDGTIRDRDYNVRGFVDRNNSERSGHSSGRHK
jgi:hypothetical protein